MADQQRSFLFLLGSTRTDGNTETLTREAASQLPADTTQTWLRLADLDLPPFQDLRHDGDGSYPAPTGDARTLLDATLAATDLVIASPLYWYSVSASTKLYLDHWSAWMRVPGIDFRARMAGRTFWAITAHSGDDADAEPLLGTLRRSADYLGMHWGGHLLASANRPGDIRTDTDALTRARALFTRQPQPALAN